MICILLLSLVLLVACSAAQGLAKQRPKVVVVVANRLLLSDLEGSSLPTIRMMLEKGAAGLLSPNCAGPKNEHSVMLTANSGSPARAGSYLKEFYDAGGAYSTSLPAYGGEDYALRTGRRAPGGSGVFLGLGRTLRENVKYGTLARPGALGDALHAAGLKTGAVGNADKRWPDPRELDRSAAVLAMDSNGIVDYAALSLDIGLLPDGAEELRRICSRADVVVMYYGGLTQLDEEKLSISDAALGTRRAKALQQLDGALGFLMNLEENGDARFVLVSFSPPGGPAWDQLTPIVVYPAGRAGLLTSASTRTPGLIAAADFAPTVLRLMNVEADENMIGRAATVVADRSPIGTLNEMSERVTAKKRLLLPMGVTAAVLGVLAYSAAALVIAFGLKVSGVTLRLLKIGLAASACLAGAFYLGSLGPAGTIGYVVTTAAALVLLTTICAGIGSLISRKTRTRALPVLLAFGMTSALILADAMTGSNLCKYCGVTSYQLSGLRFYGIGNEFAGVLIGMSAALALLLPKRGLAVPLIGIVVIVTLGLGHFGANYGETAAAAMTFGLLWFAASRKGFGAWHVALAFAAAIAAYVMFALIDMFIAGPAGTHAARVTGLTQNLGAGFLSSTLVRKMALNLKYTFTIGLRVFLAFVPFLAIWFWKVRGKVQTLYKDDPAVMAGAKAVLWGSGAAFLLNDSGIVSASIMIAMTVLVLLYSVLEEQRAEGTAA